MRLHANVTTGPLTTVAAAGEASTGAEGLGPGTVTGDAPLIGPQPSALQAFTSTNAAPVGTLSVTGADETILAATVSAPPPGPVPCCTTCTRYKSAPGTVVNAVVKEFPPVTLAEVTAGVPVGAGPNWTRNSTAAPLSSIR